jgi:hypothetical protein
VSREVFELRVGAYAPCRKFLRDRVGRVLTTGEVEAYARLVAALAETLRLTRAIDAAIEAAGGWPAAFGGQGQTSTRTPPENAKP